ncbi:unnamed protein product [Owenia fusiformis]|uniref:Innexin n=1 Tax=Owenia fusiformis TaxID=6347 RepID=A0A8S4MVZ9_OWEFU|nr:unnamed protein product [Owenia fusiformis]
MERFIGAIGSVGKLDAKLHDDAVDRINHRYTVAVLAVFALLVSTSSYVGDPMTCWTPAHFTGQMVQYTDDYCWIKNTYYHPMHEVVPREGEPRDFDVTYYQWVPLFLMIQALLFYIPSGIWHIFNDKTGINIHNIIVASNTVAQVVPEGREKTMKHLVRHIDAYLERQKEHRKGRLNAARQFMATKMCCVCVGKRAGNFLLVLYMCCKVLYIINVIGQLFMLNAFLGTKYHLYGFDVLRDLAAGNDWTASPVFPRITLCSFKMRVLGNVQRHTLQCVLPINLFNEKIYVFIWFWYVFVATVTCINFLSWLTRIFHGARMSFIKKHLAWMGRLNEEDDRQLFTRFVDNYLRPDGFLLLRLIAKNSTEFVTSEIIAGLWDNYKRVYSGGMSLTGNDKEEKESEA